MDESDLIDGIDGVVAGHGRLEAAKLLGLKEVPTICIGDLTRTQIRAYIVADNRLAELADWDDALLRSELLCLSKLELDFELEVVGFETAEIDLRIGSVEEGPSPDEADTQPSIETVLPPISKPGDLWLLGTHRLLCANSTSAEAFICLLEGQKPRWDFSIPFNVPIDGHVCGLGAVKHEEFAMASGEMTEAEFTDFLSTVLGHMST